MKDVEKKALTILQKAFSALSGKGEREDVVHYLHRLERNSPALFVEVIDQLEGDNGRWATAAQMPAVEVCRDAQNAVEAIIFSATGGSAEPEAFIWLSDRVDIKWFESFAEDLLQTNAPRARALMKRPPVPFDSEETQPSSKP
jgi:hypothetical protein